MTVLRPATAGGSAPVVNIRPAAGGLTGGTMSDGGALSGIIQPVSIGGTKFQYVRFVATSTASAAAHDTTGTISLCIEFLPLCVSYEVDVLRYETPPRFDTCKKLLCYSQSLDDNNTAGFVDAIDIHAQPNVSWLSVPGTCHLQLIY